MYIRICLLLVLFSYGGFMAGYFTVNNPPSVIVEEPLTDWEKFYKEDVYISVGLIPSDNNNDYELLFVDQDCCYTVGWGSLRGCGPTQLVYYQIHSVRELKNKLKCKPSKNAKFVVIGLTGKIKLYEVQFHYEDN